MRCRALSCASSKQKRVDIDGKTVILDDVSHVGPGDVVAVAIEPSLPERLTSLKAQSSFLCESTYLESHRHLAEKHFHLTASQAAEMAKKAGVETLVLTTFQRGTRTWKNLGRKRVLCFPTRLLRKI